ncbi:hypothetical protein MOTE_19200 [Moorella thermoacetica]|uniref:Uncharacterized protein n=1 Tax=Neomoorella thermoacetica TaxID=1525 RepID=A0A1J5NJ13_NEOTH|nr:hypothetical protein MOTE_19200 [Moorella thermoacetica]
MKSKKWFVLLGFTLIALFSFMTVLHANENAKIKKAQDIGLAYKDAEKADEVVAYVNNVPITAGEYLATYASVQNNFALLQQDANKLGPKGKTMVDNTSKLLNKYSPGTIALAKQLSDTAAYSEAIKKGLLKSDQEVQDYIQSIRKMEESNPEAQKTIQIVGESRYFDQVQPKLLKKGLTIGALKAQVISEQKDWTQYKYDLAKNAELKVVNNELITSTKEEALKYLKEMQDVFKP